MVELIFVAIITFLLTWAAAENATRVPSYNPPIPEEPVVTPTKRRWF